MVIVIQRTNFQIVDDIKDSSKIISNEYDLFIDQQYINLEILPEYINLEIIDAYNGRNLLFNVNDKFLEINLGNMNDWPAVKDDPSLRQVRLRISYRQNLALEKKKFGTVFSTNFNINGPIQPDLKITVPKGMILKSNKLKGSYLIKNPLKKQIVANEIEFEYITEKNNSTYNFLIKLEDYNIMLDSIDENSEIEYIFNYDITYNYLFFLFPILSLFALLSILILTYYSLNFNLNLKNISVVLSVFTFFLGNIIPFYKEGYSIPYFKLTFLFIILSIILLVFLSFH